jgi:hypothetical protein
MNGEWTQIKFWWHPCGAVKMTTFVDTVMPIGWIQITAEMYKEFLGLD